MITQFIGLFIPHLASLYNLYGLDDRGDIHVFVAINDVVYPFATGWFHLWAWWRHQMETFSALLAICVGNSPAIGEFPSQRPVTPIFDVFFDLR